MTARTRNIHRIVGGACVIALASVAMFFAYKTPEPEPVSTIALKTHTATLIEGKTIIDFDARLHEAGIIEKGALIEYVHNPERWPDNWKNKYWFYDIVAERGVEGYVFPDTYEWYLPDTPEHILQKCFDNFVVKTENIFETNDMEDRYDTLILASILEKEVQTIDDMRIVADIFSRRMRAGWLLQSDATLRYVIRKNDATLDAEELKSTSPYNSYKFKGLPPTPIGNPGAHALRAATNPSPNAYWYFLTDANGTVHYAIDHDTHVRNKWKHLK